jgi:hypothetical protein
VTYFKKNYYYIFLFFFIFIGAHFSINTGITHDELHDFNVSVANKNFVLNFFFDKNLDTSYLVGTNKFYGSGFHYISSILELFTVHIPQLSEFSLLGKKLLAKHISVFILFFISGLLLRKIIKLITKKKLYANLSSIFYLLYPYLLGHSFFNVKDIPFLTFWLICTYFLIRIIKNYLTKEIILKKHIFFLSLFSAYLLSIRISGILIFVQYLIFILTMINVKKLSILNFLKDHLKDIIMVFFITMIFYIILHPSYWENPFLIFDAIMYMSQHAQTACTITLGECMKAQNLPASYLPIWFFFKTPIIILCGLIAYFKIENEVAKKPLEQIILVSLTLSILAILILLIFFNVNLYDEIRQVMFLMPLIFIVALSLLHFFSRKISIISISFFIIYFIVQNINIYPYNYIWLNNLSHITKVQNIFELDYWGASTKNISNYFKSNVKNNACIITNRNDAINTLIPGDKCLVDFKKLHNKNQRPFYVALMERGVNKGTPTNCELVFKEEKSINFSKEKVVLAKVFKCN